MIKRGHLLFLEDILLAMDKIEKYINNMSQQDFEHKKTLW